MANSRAHKGWIDTSRNWSVLVYSRFGFYWHRSKKTFRKSANQAKHIWAEIGPTVHEFVTFDALTMPFKKKKKLFWQIVSFSLARTHGCLLRSVGDIRDQGSHFTDDKMEPRVEKGWPWGLQKSLTNTYWLQGNVLNTGGF